MYNLHMDQHADAFIKLNTDTFERMTDKEIYHFFRSMDKAQRFKYINTVERTMKQSTPNTGYSVTYGKTLLCRSAALARQAHEVQIRQSRWMSAVGMICLVMIIL